MAVLRGGATPGATTTISPITWTTHTVWRLRLGGSGAFSHCAYGHDIPLAVPR